MRQGYVPTGVCAPELILGDPVENANGHVRMIMAAKNHGTKILVFPELSITGSSLERLFSHRKLSEKVEDGISMVVEATKDSDIIAVFGAPVSVGGRLYDCAVVAGNGHIHGVVPKSIISRPDHRDIFTPAPAANGTCVLCGMQVPFGTDLIFESLIVPELRIAVEIGEDCSAVISPGARHALAGATVICQLTSDKEHASSATETSNMLREQSKRYASTFLRSGAGYGESISGGMSLGHMCIIENGEILKDEICHKASIVSCETDVQLLQAQRERISEFRDTETEGYETVYFNQSPITAQLVRSVGQTPFVWSEASRDAWCDTIMQMQVDAIARRMESTEAGYVVVMLDGGVASTVAAYNAARAVAQLGKEPGNVVCVTCRGPGCSNARSNRAISFADCLKTSSAVLDITEQYSSRLALIGLDENTDPEGAMEIAAGMRRSIAEDIAVQVGGLVINTDDMTDWAMGNVKTPSGTDTLAVNAGIPKTAMRWLLMRIYEQENEYTALENVLRAVLVEDGGKCNPGRGKDLKATEQSKVTELQLNDFFMYYIIRYGFSPNKVMRLSDAAFGKNVSDVIQYKYLSEFFRAYMANRVLRFSIPDGPRYFETDLRDDRLNGDFYENLWEEELQAIVPEGVDDIETEAANEIAAEEQREQEERRREAGLEGSAAEINARLEAARAKAEAQIEQERRREAAGTSVVGRKMDGMDEKALELARIQAAQQQDNIPDMTKDPNAYFEAMRKKAEAQIERERDAERNR